MRRRDFIAFVGGAAAPLAVARAQQPAVAAAAPVVGFLSGQRRVVGHTFWTRSGKAWRKRVLWKVKTSQSSTAGLRATRTGYRDSRWNWCSVR